MRGVVIVAALVLSTAARAQESGFVQAWSSDPEVRQRLIPIARNVAEDELRESMRKQRHFQVFDSRGRAYSGVIEEE